MSSQKGGLIALRTDIPFQQSFRCWAKVGKKRRLLAITRIVVDSQPAAPKYLSDIDCSVLLEQEGLSNFSVIVLGCSNNRVHRDDLISSRFRDPVQRD